MNIILFEISETTVPLPRGDPRAEHITKTLRREAGDTFDAGIIDGPRGKGTVEAVTDGHLDLSFEWGDEPPPLDPITLLVGLSRPQTMRKILQEATTLSVSAMRFVTTGRGESSYARSKVWTTGEWRRHVIAGAEQAFSTRLPKVTHGDSLETAIRSLSVGSCRIALDNYESPRSLSDVEVGSPAVLAVGPERGWSTEERDVLRDAGFAFAHLGERPLRVETACVAGLAVLRSRLDLFGLASG
jgi:16S rRNA (uracil1498-N3)-methyltransferase